MNSRAGAWGIIMSLMSEIISRFSAFPPYGIAALVVLLLYALQSEIRFGSSAQDAP